MRGKWRAGTVCAGAGGGVGRTSWGQLHSPAFAGWEMFLNGSAPQAVGGREDGRQHTPSPSALVSEIPGWLVGGGERVVSSTSSWRPDSIA